MKTYDVNLNFFMGGIETASEIVIAENVFDAAIAVLEKLKQQAEMSPAMASPSNFEPKKQMVLNAAFELRCFPRSRAIIL